ncbi:MAG: helix-turn-helix domain-containing protein [Chloroflexi bacterium]|nr:helix-turn-helix domain-containing protein [Chloroflexota bacterium]
MTPLRLGRLARAARHRLGLRQVDVAARAHTSESTVSRVERGDLRTIRWADLERACAVVEVRVDLSATWRGAEGAALLDREHAALVELIVRELAEADWLTVVEYGFNHYGDRGSVDILAWHASSRSLLIIEVKTQIVDVQELHSSLAKKVRVVPDLVARDRGWVASSVSQVLVVGATRTARRVIERHRATFDSALPARTVEARRWIQHPSGRLAGVMFVTEPRRGTLRQGSGRSRRIRAPRSH